MTENTYQPLFWGIVELFGHNIIAGEVGEQTICGESFIRVDVPEIDEQPGFTKYYGRGAIYAMTPCDELSARVAVEGLRAKPVEVWKLNLPQLNADNKDEDEND